MGGFPICFERTHPLYFGAPKDRICHEEYTIGKRSFIECHIDVRGSVSEFTDRIDIHSRCLLGVLIAFDVRRRDDQWVSEWPLNTQCVGPDC